MVVCRSYVGNVDLERPVQRRRLPFPRTAPSLLLWGACGGEGDYYRLGDGRRGAQISCEQRLVALADVTVYVGGRRAQRSRKMGAVR